ncbi:hypothetical protein EV363DRAFT_1188558 [Boletus edulis]|nr:hypothetical protein EV363DRAFT_1188558 [Boletus edulis]
MRASQERRRDYEGVAGASQGLWGRHRSITGITGALQGLQEYCGCYKGIVNISADDMHVLLQEHDMKEKTYIMGCTIWRQIVHLNHVIMPKERWFEIEYNRRITEALQGLWVCHKSVAEVLQRLWGGRKSVAEIMGASQERRRDYGGGAGASQRLCGRRRDYGGGAGASQRLWERRRDYGSIMGGAQERHTDYRSIVGITKAF